MKKIWNVYWTIYGEYAKTNEVFVYGTAVII
jgi:hypothetical protein